MYILEDLHIRQLQRVGGCAAHTHGLYIQEDFHILLGGWLGGIAHNVVLYIAGVVHTADLYRQMPCT